MTLLTFDPGVTTGWAFYSPRTDGYRVGHLDNSLADVYAFLGKVKPRKVAYEKFADRPNKATVELYSVEVIGVIKLWCQQNYVENYNYNPSTVKAFWKDNKIKKLDLWVKDMPHAMDALRVLLAHRARTEPEWMEQTLRTMYGNIGCDNLIYADLDVMR